MKTLKIQVKTLLIEGLFMTTTLLQFMLEGPRLCTTLCFKVHTTVEYLEGTVNEKLSDFGKKKIFHSFVRYDVNE